MCKVKYIITTATYAKTSEAWEDVPSDRAWTLSPCTISTVLKPANDSNRRPSCISKVLATSVTHSHWGIPLCHCSRQLKGLPQHNPQLSSSWAQFPGRKTVHIKDHFLLLHHCSHLQGYQLESLLQLHCDTLGGICRTFLKVQGCASPQYSSHNRPSQA